MYLPMYIHMCVCIYVSTYVYMYVCVFVYGRDSKKGSSKVS